MRGRLASPASWCQPRPGRTLETQREGSNRLGVREREATTRLTLDDIKSKVMDVLCSLEPLKGTMAMQWSNGEDRLSTLDKTGIGTILNVFNPSLLSSPGPKPLAPNPKT